MRFIKLAVTLSLTAALLASCASCPCHEAKMVQQQQGQYCHMAVVSGMTCESCAQTLTANLSKQAHVQSVDVDVASGQVKVYTDKQGALSKKSVGDVVSKSGYALTSFAASCQ